MISIVLNLCGQILRDCKPSDLGNSFINLHCAQCLPGYNEQGACETKSVKMQLFLRKFSDYLFILNLYYYYYYFFPSGFVKYSSYFGNQLSWSHV